MFSNENPLALGEELRRICRIMGRKDIKTVFTGDGASTNGRTIKLPALPLDAKMTIEEQSVYRGYQIHEVAHVRYTNMDLWNTTVVTADQRLIATWNCLEDGLIERRSVERKDYSSFVRHMSTLMDIVIGRNNQEIAVFGRGQELWQTELPYATLQISRMHYGNRSEELRKYVFGLPEELGRTAERWERRLRKCVSTEETLELAKKMVEFINQAEDDKKTQDAQDKNSQESKDHADQNQNNDGGQPHSGAEDRSSGSGEANADASDGNDTGSDDRDDRAKQDEQVGQRGTCSSDGVNDGGNVPDIRAGNDGGRDEKSGDRSGAAEQNDQVSNQGQAHSGRDEPGGKSDDALGGWQPNVDELRDAVNGIAKCKPSDHQLRTIDTDDSAFELSPLYQCLQDFLDKSTHKHWRQYKYKPRLAKEVSEELARTTTLNVKHISKCMRISRLLLAREDKRKTSGMLQGRVDRRRLASLIAGRKDVFSKTTTMRTRKTLVSVVMDASSSMHSAPTMKLGFALNEILSRSGIDYEFSAWSSNGNVILKHPNERMGDVRKKIAQYGIFRRGNTPMSSAMNTSGLRISQQNYERKIMLFITDMQPNSGHRDHMPLACRSLEAQGVEVVGIGIGDKANLSDDMFTHVIVSLDMNEACDVILDKLEQLLMSREFMDVA